MGGTNVLFPEVEVCAGVGLLRPIIDIAGEKILTWTGVGFRVRVTTVNLIGMQVKVSDNGAF